MIGRAGRPGFDTSGTAVIMTDNKSKERFQKLATSGLQPATSQLLFKFDEILNAEISQRVVTSVDSALNWLKGTLYAVQLNHDPSSFGVQRLSHLSIEAHLLQVCRDSIARLKVIGALEHLDGQVVQPCQASHVMVSSRSENRRDFSVVNLVSHQNRFPRVSTWSIIKPWI